MTAQAVGQFALTYVPAMNTVFHTAPIGWDVWLRILAIAVVAGLVVAVEKRLRRGRREPQVASVPKETQHDHGDTVM